MERLTPTKEWRESEGVRYATYLEKELCMAYDERLSAIEDVLGDHYDLDRLRELVKARDEGRVAIWPAELWAVKPNPMSNEWNDEPEYHIVHYIVHAFEPETGRYFVNTDNYSGLKQRHWIKGKGLYKTRAEAEAAIGGGGDG